MDPDDDSVVDLSIKKDREPESKESPQDLSRPKWEEPETVVAEPDLKREPPAMEEREETSPPKEDSDPPPLPPPLPPLTTAEMDSAMMGPPDVEKPGSRDESGAMLAPGGAPRGGGVRRGGGHHHRPIRRNLRPRTERNYAESPDVIILSDEEPQLNGYSNGYESDSDDGEMPPSPTIKELNPEERAERDRAIRKLREELRNEEMKLVLLKKLRQSQQMKETLEASPVTPAAAAGGSGVPVGVPQQTPGGGVLPQSKPLPTVVGPKMVAPIQPPSQQSQSQQSQQVPPPLLRVGQSKQMTPGINPSLLRGVHGPLPHLLGPQGGRGGAGSLQTNLLLAQQNLLRGAPGLLGSRTPVTTPPNVVLGYSMGSSGQQAQQDSRPKDAHPSPPTQVSAQDRSRGDDNQTPAQRQAAAKLALRKQLEKTLLQIPPPKPPPPEMHFIPNPSNTEFIYLLGLEHVVDFITRDPRLNQVAPDPFTCSQCNTDFTPVWKWDKNSKGKETKVICEQCVTTNVKKALKAEHTNRLKTAFVKALQQEQEIEQRMAQVANSPHSHQQDMMAPKSGTPNSASSSSPSPTIPQTPPNPPPSSHPPPISLTTTAQPSPSSSSSLPKLADPKFGSVSPSAAALQVWRPDHSLQYKAAHQQLLRLPPPPPPPPPQPLPAHLLAPFGPLLYPYQLAMAASGKGPVTPASLAELQRQYLLDMIPPRTLPQQGGAMNWKT